jgi:glutamate-1-semialdehyde 2,1-aminomutase
MTQAISAVASRSDDLLRRADRAFPSGALGTFLLPSEVDFVVARGKGAHVWSIDGTEYVDYVLGSGPMILGHAHPSVTDAIARQAAEGTTYYALNPVAIELAERVLSVFPTGQKVLLTSSGSEATFYAMRLARAFTSRSGVIKFAGAYHGHQDYAMPDAFTPTKAGQSPKAASAGVPQAVAATTYVAEFNNLDSVESIFADHAHDIAAVIVEPYQRVLEPDPDFLVNLTKLAHDHGALLIADEVVTGFRFRYGTAQQEYGFEADLTALGKIIGGGLPVAAVVGRSDVLALADARRRAAENYVYASGTLNGYALGAAAGVATLDELRAPGAYERLNALGEKIRVSMRDQISTLHVAAQVVGHGPMFHVLFGVTEAPRTTADLAVADRGAGARFGAELIRNRVLVNPLQRSYVSLAHTDEDIEFTIAAIGRALTVVG